jgi:hypothetical protein
LAEPDRNRIAAKLWQLPGRLLLALIDATAILVIVAGILALVVIARIDNFAGNVVATMTEATLSRIDLPSRDVLANLGAISLWCVGVGTRGSRPSIRDRKTEQPLTALDANVDRLASARTFLTDEAIGQLGGRRKR